MEVSELIQQQKLSPVKLVAECLSRIEKFNPLLNAFITVIADEAREQAKVAEAEIKAGKWRGLLHGIPIGVKDFFDTAGVKTTAGFEHFKNRIPKKDAVAVARLKEAGAIIVGKMNMDKLGMATTGLTGYFGPVRNPWHDDYIPGGSSAGSAVAIASGLCYATIDTDAVGSVRLPAACCGVVGFKGSYDNISTKGILDGEPVDDFIKWMGHVGITTRSVEDTALLFDVLAGHDKKNTFSVDLTDSKLNIRVGVGNNFTVEKKVSDAFENAVKIIRGIGNSTSSVAVPFGDPAQGSMATIEVDRAAIAGQAFKDVDVIVLPTTQTTVPKVKEAKGNDQGLSAEITAFANYYGLPAISVPCGFDKNSLPIGLQIVGKPGDDQTVLQFAYHYQKATDYNTKHPIL